jgi:hypothetical protein
MKEDVEKDKNEGRNPKAGCRQGELSKLENVYARNKSK